MNITCLVENTSLRGDLTPKHGLSLYIETCDHTLLFDMGPDETFLENASILGLDPAAVDTAFISHGHYDHGGGIPGFQKINTDARIFMTQKALEKFYAMGQGTLPRYIGLDHDALDTAQCEFITRDVRVSDTLQVFTGFPSSGFIPRGNDALYTERPGGKKVKDDFSHELALLIQEDKKNVLVTGCSHSGIGNMLAAVLDRTGLTKINHVIGGFHLYNPVAGKTESNERLDRFARELSAHPGTRFYTGHCTGPEAPAYLNNIMKNRISSISTGTQIEI